MSTSDETAAPRPPRYQLLDFARGVAILMMVVFHVAWDLYYFGFSPTDVTTDPPWVAFQKTILASFLLLVGAGLILAHGNGIRWPKFWRRFCILVVAALLVTAGTYWMFPDYFVFFGVLHAIALFSLMTLPLLRLTGWQLVLAGVVVVLVSFTYTNPVFTERWLSWLGFWPVSPPTSDVVPIFPWFGVVLIGAGLMRLLLASRWATPLEAWRSRNPLLVGIAFLGRWSLPVYLVHQPLIIGVLYALMQLQPALPVVPDAPPPRAVGFTQTCQESCVASGGDAAHCTTYCGCALDQIEQGDLWAVVEAATRTTAQQADVDRIMTLCRSMAR